MTTLQVPDIDDTLYSRLHQKASEENRSIGQLVVAILQRGLAEEPDSFAWRDEAVLKLAGGWMDEHEADEIIRDIYESRTTGREIEAF